MVDFPLVVSPFTQNFCVTANGSHSDIEIAILPLNNAIPNSDANYKIVYNNKGTVVQSGSANLNFDDTVLDFLTANPAISSQSTNNLNWTFTNLNPLEARTILVTFHVNSNSTIGQIVPFTATGSLLITDEYPNDNSIRFNQTVVGSEVTNEKICLEGNSVSTTQIDEYVHYCIRFKNTGTALAQNLVVKDIIDATKYDITTLFPIDGSHVFETRITDSNTVEFIFENINLAFGNTNSDGYVLFKIKILPTLTIGDTFTNTASIYLDYKAPLSTNNESTIISALANQSFDSSHNFTIYPNPVNEELNIHAENLFIINSMTIYNSLGQLMQVIISPNDLSINVSRLKTGIYFLNIKSENGVSSIKFIKE